MPTVYFFFGGTLALVLLLACTRRWAYVCFLALTELAWALAGMLYIAAALDSQDVALFYWVGVWFFLAAAELVVGSFLFVAHACTTGASRLV